MRSTRVVREDRALHLDSAMERWQTGSRGPAAGALLLLYDLKLGLAAVGSAGIAGWSGFRRSRSRCGHRFGAAAAREEQPLAVLLRKDPGYGLDRYRALTRDAVEARRELDPLVADGEAMGGVVTDVKHDLAVLHELRGDPGVGIHLHRDVGREAAVRAPFVHGADEVRL